MDSISCDWCWRAREHRYRCVSCSRGFNAEIKSAELEQRLSGESLETMPIRPYVKKDIAKWTELVTARELEMD